MKQTLKDGDEYDCVSKYFRTNLSNNNRPGMLKKVKRRLNKRFRKEGKGNRAIVWKISDSQDPLRKWYRWEFKTAAAAKREVQNKV